jgi:hypothetical protein
MCKYMHTQGMHSHMYLHVQQYARIERKHSAYVRVHMRAHVNMHTHTCTKSHFKFVIAYIRCMHARMRKHVNASKHSVTHTHIRTYAQAEDNHALKPTHVHKHTQTHKQAHVCSQE